MRNRKFVNFIILLIITMVAVASVALILQGTTEEGIRWQRASAEDSGVTACKNVAEEAKGRSMSDGKKMTQEDVLVAKTPFLTSKYTDIRLAGTTLVDTIYRADVANEADEFGTALTLLAKLQSQWESLQLACANHGVKLPGLRTN